MILNLEVLASAGSVAIDESKNIETDGLVAVTPSIPAAQPLTSWVKTDANTAAGNLPNGHGLTSGVYNVYWTGGSRLGVTGTVATNALSLDGGSGDDFPASADTTVYVAQEIEFNVSIDGDNLSAIVFDLCFTSKSIDVDGYVVLKDSGAAVIATLDLKSNRALAFDFVAGHDNPFTGNPIVVGFVSHKSQDAAATLKILGAVDVTP